MNDETKQPVAAPGPVSGHDASSLAWADFWSGTHSIYVNERHAQVHYQRIARDLSRLIEERSRAHGRPLVLDWGCGDALNAPALVELCQELWLYDAVEAVRGRVAGRFAGISGIRVLNDADWQGLAPASLDVVIVVSVAQYLSRADLEALMDKMRVVLKPNGEVIFADIITPHVSMVADITSLLRTGWDNGFFIAAGVGLARTFFSEYRRIRATAGFSTYEADDFLGLLRAHGFDAQRLTHNVGFNQQRMTFRATPKA